MYVLIFSQKNVCVDLRRFFDKIIYFIKYFICELYILISHRCHFQTVVGNISHPLQEANLMEGIRNKVTLKSIISYNLVMFV